MRTDETCSSFEWKPNIQNLNRWGYQIVNIALIDKKYKTGRCHLRTKFVLLAECHFPLLWSPYEPNSKGAYDGTCEPVSKGAYDGTYEPVSKGAYDGTYEPNSKGAYDGTYEYCRKVTAVCGHTKWCRPLPHARLLCRRIYLHTVVMFIVSRYLPAV